MILNPWSQATAAAVKWQRANTTETILGEQDEKKSSLTLFITMCLFIRVPTSPPITTILVQTVFEAEPEIKV